MAVRLRTAPKKRATLNSIRFFMLEKAIKVTMSLTNLVYFVRFEFALLTSFTSTSLSKSPLSQRLFPERSRRELTQKPDLKMINNLYIPVKVRQTDAHCIEYTF